MSLATLKPKINISLLIVKEEFEDTKGVIRIRKSKKNRKQKTQWPKEKGQTTIYKTLHRKLMIKQDETPLTNFIAIKTRKLFSALVNNVFCVDNRKRRSDVTTIVDLATALPAGNL